MSIAIAKTKLIREYGKDEFWLQDQICKNPEILVPTLGANVLEVVSKEKRQSVDLIYFCAIQRMKPSTKSR
jgi:hypothetical protein